jgi:hypothetical protein
VNWEIRQGDARELLPKVGPVDAIITDPVWPNAPAGMFPEVADPEALLRDTLVDARCKRLVIILRGDSDPRFLRAVPARFPFFRSQQLTYALPSYIGRKLGGDETAYCFGEPIPVSVGARVIPARGPIAQPRDRLRNGHPCSRALVHMRWLVRWWSLPGETICDPFAGSGQTGVAAVEQGRRFVGIEIDPEYCALARRRIQESTRQANLPMAGARA